MLLVYFVVNGFDLHHIMKLKTYLLRLALPIFLVIYLTGGIFTLVSQVLALPFPLSIFMDFGFYEQALRRARQALH